MFYERLIILNISILNFSEGVPASVVVKEFLNNAETDVIIWILYFLPKSEGERVQMDHPLSHQIRWPCTNVTNHLLLLLNVPMTSTPLHSRGWLCSGVHNAEFFQILCPESTLAFDLGTTGSPLIVRFLGPINTVLMEIHTNRGVFMI